MAIESIYILLTGSVTINLFLLIYLNRLLNKIKLRKGKVKLSKEEQELLRMRLSRLKRLV